jgi:hypothetical protein
LIQTAAILQDKTPVLYPNPYIASGDELKMDIFSTANCREVEFKFYTSALRLVLDQKTDVNFSGKATVKIDTSKMADFARGTYYYAAFTTSDTNERKRITTGVLIILR